MADLTTLAAVKAYMGISGSDLDAKLTTLLTAASRAVESYCDRVFASTAYVEYFDGLDNFRQAYMHLRQCPVSSVSRIATERFNAMTLKNTSASVQIATVAVTTTGITLATVASGVSSSESLLFSTYPTLTALAGALPAGWEYVIASDYTLWPSAYLRQPQGVLNAKAGGLTNGAALQTYIRELSDCRIDYDEGTIFGYFPDGPLEAEVRYTAGYSTIPDDVQLATCMVVKAMNDQIAIDATLDYEKLGDYSWGRRTGQDLTTFNQIFANAMPLLMKYRRIRIL